MPETSVAALEARQQKLIENARIALERGNLDYVLEVTAQVLKAAPACLAVRRLQRVAQLRQARAKGGGFMARMTSGLSSAPFLFGSGKKDPARLLEAAETVLAKDPGSVSALKMLAEAAQGLQWPETAAFALEAIREIEPANRANLLALGAVWMAAGKPAEAVKVADELLRLRPADPEAQDLLRQASVAQTVTQSGWENQTSYRDKLRDERQAVSLEQSGKIKVSDEMAARLLQENLTRVAQEPDNLNHYRAVVQACRAAGDLGEALAWVRKARQRPTGAMDPTLEKQEAELAAAVLERGLQTAMAEAAAAPGDPAARAKVDLARRELAEFKIGETRRYVERYPNDHAARLAFGALLLEHAQTDAAIAQFQQAQKGPQVRVPALMGLGRCFQAKRLHDLAAAQFGTVKAELATMDETKKEAVYELGVCLEAMGRREEAMAEFKLVYGEDIGFRDVAQKIDVFYAR